MADLSLLFKLRGDASGVKTATAESRQAIASLRGSLGSEFATIQQTSQRALGSVVQSLTTVSGQAPVTGTAISALGASIGAMAAFASVVAVPAIGALAAGIFSLAKETADYADSLDDLSGQTGLSVGLLSTLKVAADQAGVSFEGSTSALAKYLKSVSDANSGNEKLRQNFIRVGFSQRDLTEAHKNSDRAVELLIDRVGALSNSQDRLNALQKIGVRNAAELNGIISELDGNFAEFQERVAKMGLLITPAQVEAAKDFDESLKFLQLTIKGIAFTFGREFVPAISGGMKEIQGSLESNEGAWNFWAQRVRETINGVRIAAAGLSAFDKSGGNALVAIAAAVGRSRELKSLAGQVTGGIGGEGPARGLGADAESGAKAKANAALQAAIRDAALAEKKAQQLIQENVEENKRALAEQVRDIEEFTKRAIQLSDDRFNALVDRTNSESDALQAALDKRLITQAEFNRKWEESGVEVEEGRQKNVNETFALEQDRDRRISAAEQAARERQLQIAEEADERQIERVRNRIEREITSESEGQREIAAIIAEGFTRKKKALEDEQAAYATAAERRLAITDQLVLLEGQRAFAAEQASRRVIDAVEREARARFDAESKGFRDATRPRRVFEQQPSPFDFDFEKFGKQIEQTVVPLNTILKNSFLQVADAIGQTAAQWVLLGQTGPAVGRKLLASALASITAEATVNAIKMAAVGFAHLASFNVAAAANAFTSAGLWAAIGGGAALIGRQVAGDAFKNPGGGASGSERGSGAQALQTINAPRNQQVVRHEHVLRIVTNDSHIIETIGKNWNDSGGLRELILKDGS